MYFKQWHLLLTQGQLQDFSNAAIVFSVTVKSMCVK